MRSFAIVYDLYSFSSDANGEKVPIEITIYINRPAIIFFLLYKS